MKKLIFILIIMSTLHETDANGQFMDLTDYKTCLVHNQIYNIRLNHLDCPELTEQQLQNFGVGPHDTVTIDPNTNKTLIQHSPECFGEGPPPV